MAKLNPDQLAYPIYLDIPMMISFLAALEGGVSKQADIRQGRTVVTTRDQAAGGRVSLFDVPGLKIDLSGRMGSSSQAQDTDEMRIVREHTAASLFNLLRLALHEGEDGSHGIARLHRLNWEEANRRRLCLRPGSRCLSEASF